jgi:pimeloyl-ACP methyl ester carboxylesterase
MNRPGEAMKFLRGSEVLLAAALLLAGSTAAAQVTFDCQTVQERAPASGLATYPKAVATVPLDKQAQGYVRVGGGCEVSRFGFDSTHAEVMVQNSPDGEYGWRCKGADPALISNPAWAKASVTFCRARDPNASSLRLQCKTLSRKTGPSRNPSAEVTLTQTLIDEGYVVVSGGCDSSHFQNGSTHAENVVVSKPSANGRGWFCQAADPPNHAQDATVEASLVACQLAVDPAQSALLSPRSALRCTVSQGARALGSYPKSTAQAAGQILGGGCELSYAGNGSAHAEFMVQHGLQGSGWACLGADPPLIPNPGSAQASVVTCGITPVSASTPLPAPTPGPGSTPPSARKNPVIIVGGTLASEFVYWTLESRLDRDGYTRDFFELPQGGLIDLHESARQLKFKVADVLLRTGAEKVHLIGHSQGGAVARAYVRDFGSSSVESIVSLGTPHKGAEMDPLLAFVATVLFRCTGNDATDPPPCHQMRAGSQFITEINQRPPDDPIYYTNFNTRNDVFTKADSNGKMDNCDRVSPSGEPLQCNVTVQDQCPLNLVEHVGLASNGAVYSGIRQALEHRRIALNCSEL